MEVFRKSQYTYVVWIAGASYDLSGEWDEVSVAKFIKEMEREE